ncbi:hypothetical protein GW17_00058765 [Ensete ventricosum]|nr:hypothetical protein GW17_00058765 [Ensete ventricosum]
MHPLRFPNSGIRAKRKAVVSPAAKLEGAVAYNVPARGDRQRPTHKGQPATASSTANRGSVAGCKGGCPLAGRLPTARGRRRLHKGSVGGGDVEREEEDLGIPFEKSIILPL